MSWRRRTRRLADAFIDIVLPPVCANCRRVGELLCADCRATVVWLDHPLCQRCGRPQDRPVQQCTMCQLEPLPLERIRAATLYTDPVRRVIHQMKYEGYFALSQPLAELMLVAWPKWQLPVDLVLPIPLHPERRRERGYNQSELLVDALKSELGWVSEPTALRRTRRTRPQVGLTARERQANVRGAFAVESELVVGKRIMLVDDVCTSGSTLAEAASVLLKAGAESVVAYCLATTPGDQDISAA